MIIAITGGIGSGKSYVCQILAMRGIKVYDCDAHAKLLMRTSIQLQKNLKLLVREHVYKEGVLQKAVLADYLLRADAHVQAVNNIIHPAVARDFEQSGMSWIESAILFDSRFYERTHIDKVVCVTAPIEVRIQRVMKRDAISREKTLDWINRQLPQEEVLKRSDYEIINDGIQSLDQQIDFLLTQLSSTENRS